MVRRLVDDQFPEFAALPLRHVPSGGTENAVYRLGDDLAVRLPWQAEAVSSLLKEVRWLPVVAPHLSLEVLEVVATGKSGEDYPFPWAVVRWLHGEDALSARLSSMSETAETLGRFVTELQGIDRADVPPAGSEGFGRGLSLVGRDEEFRAALAQCEGLIDVDRVARVWDDALAAPAWDGPPVWPECSTSARCAPATRLMTSRRRGTCLTGPAELRSSRLSERTTRCGAEHVVWSRPAASSLCRTTCTPTRRW